MEPDRPSQANTLLNVLVVVLAFSIPLYREWVSITAPLITVLWFFDGRVRDKLKVLRQHHLSLAVLLFVGFNLVSVLWSSEPLDGLEYADTYRSLFLIPVSGLPRIRRGRILSGPCVLPPSALPDKENREPFSSKSSQLSWAWVDSNDRPHAYQAHTK